jgi:hypothetical protein
MRGRTWWIRGESMAANDSKSGHEKHAIFFAHFLIFFATSDGRKPQ